MKLVELHVFFVPDDHFDRRLNKVSAAAVDSFISAGFIRSVTFLSLGLVRRHCLHEYFFKVGLL